MQWAENEEANNNNNNNNNDLLIISSLSSLEIMHRDSLFKLQAR
jgi:hypothetical protein